MQSGCRSGDGTFVGREDGLEILPVFRGDFLLDPRQDRRFTQGEEGLLELIIGTVEEETQGTAAGGRVVDDFGYQTLVLAEIKLVADADLAGGIDDDVPQALLLVELAQQEDLDVCAGLFLVAVQAGRKDLRVVEDEGVILAEILDDVLEEFVLDFSGGLVQDHKPAFVAPSRGIGRDLVLGQVEVELGKFHNVLVGCRIEGQLNIIRLPMEFVSSQPQKRRENYTFASRKTSAMEGYVFFRKGGRLDLATQAAFEISSSVWGVRSTGSV